MSTDAAMDRSLTEEEASRSKYLAQRRLLRDVCQALRHDDGGRYCVQCSVREFCDSQARRGV